MKEEIYKTGFFVQLTGLCLILFLLGLSASAGKNPKTLLKRKAPSREFPEQPVPVEFYEFQSWINEIKPDETTIEALNMAQGIITISFANEMNEVPPQVTSRSIMTKSQELNEDGGIWIDSRTFSLSLDRNLAHGEFIKLTLVFEDANGREQPPVRINYE